MRRDIVVACLARAKNKNDEIFFNYIINEQ